MHKKLTITIDYNTDDNPDEYQVLKEELEWVMDLIQDGYSEGDNEFRNPETGKKEIITEYKIQEL